MSEILVMLHHPLELIQLSYVVKIVDNLWSSVVWALTFFKIILFSGFGEEYVCMAAPNIYWVCWSEEIIHIAPSFHSVFGMDTPEMVYWNYPEWDSPKDFTKRTMLLRVQWRVSTVVRSVLTHNTHKRLSTDGRGVLNHRTQRTLNIFVGGNIKTRTRGDSA